MVPRNKHEAAYEGQPRIGGAKIGGETVNRDKQAVNGAKKGLQERSNGKGATGESGLLGCVETLVQVAQELLNVGR